MIDRIWAGVAVLVVSLLAVSGPAAAQAPRPQYEQVEQNAMLGTRAGGSVPVPDPTTLTVELLNREVATLKEQIRQAAEEQQKLSELQFRSLREIVDLQQKKVEEFSRGRTAELDRMREETAKMIDALRELVFERFAMVDVRFGNVDNQFGSRDAAVAAALEASKSAASNALMATEKAVATAGVVTKESIDQQARLFSESTNSLRTSVDDLKAAVGNLEAKTASNSEVYALAQRLTAIEARTAGIGEAKTSFGDNVGIIGVIGGLILGIMGFVMGGRREVRYVDNGALTGRAGSGGAAG